LSADWDQSPTKKKKNVITFTLSQSDHIKRLLLWLIFKWQEISLTYTYTSKLVTLSKSISIFI
jgi:hypothetical protein